MEIQRIKISEEDRSIVSIFMKEECPLEIDFNWLMPVIEKIEDIDIRNNGYDFPKVKFLGDNVEIFAYATYRGTAYYWKKWYTIGGKWVCHTNQATTKIEAAWLAVVEFIRWYNPQKQ